MLLDLKIAELKFRIESDIAIRGLKSKKLKHFQANNITTDINHYYKVIPGDSITLPPLNKNEKLIVRKCFSSPKESLPDNPLFCSYIIREKLNECFEHIDYIDIEIQPQSIVIFDHKNRDAHFFYSQDYGKCLTDLVLGPNIFAPFLPNFAAVMIHSSSVVLDNKAAIFLAPDEGGKTTAAELSSGLPILCDDQNIIRKQGDEYFVHGTPWGIHRDNSNMVVPGAFFLLIKDKEFKLKKLDHKEIFSFLWREHHSYYFNLPKIIKREYFNFLYDLSRSHPGYLLSFPKDYINWDAINDAMNT